jgi:hypothetical protein
MRRTQLHSLKKVWSSVSTFCRTRYWLLMQDTLVVYIATDMYGLVGLKQTWKLGLMASAVRWGHPKCFLFASDTAPVIHLDSLSLRWRSSTLHPWVGASRVMTNSWKTARPPPPYSKLMLWKLQFGQWYKVSPISCSSLMIGFKIRCYEQMLLCLIYASLGYQRLDFGCLR